MRLTDRFEIAASSSIGRIRRYNKDSHRATTYPAPVGNLLGVKAIGVDSKLAIEVSRTSPSPHMPSNLYRPREAAGLERVMDKAYHLAQRRILNYAHLHPDHRGIGTTLTSILVNRWNHHGVIGHIGDSRAYQSDPGSLVG